MIDNYNLLTFHVHSAEHSQGGIVNTVAELLTFLEDLLGRSPSEVFSMLLPGISGIENIHPLVVHFPIAFLLAYFVIDLLANLLKKPAWHQFSTGLLYLGTIAAGAAVAAGLAAEGSVEHGGNVHAIMKKHEIIGISVLCLAVFLSLWRVLSHGMIEGIANILNLSCSALLVLLIILGADLGSLMVYKHGVAVEAVEDSMIDYFHEHSH
ncbi:MAG: DUF2231 domain-containing protein [Methylococcales symbiont of Hymedesmia sp. n. MRB-2018]|nr:MAG: DUF2231 domain-containing protein [Methylococcales symbiont of Hymedesmia sp. n. MRB-2018]KAF3984198.1 MAG: DUF2231 domain-containing protein [Methylococcales symbiont of Hymedesmia sp. n. MRB-2018]